MRYLSPRGTHTVLVDGDRLYSMAPIHNIILRGALLSIAWYHDGVRVLDVSNPTKPRQVSHYNTFRETAPDRTDSPFEGLLVFRELPQP